MTRPWLPKETYEATQADERRAAGERACWHGAMPCRIPGFGGGSWK